MAHKGRAYPINQSLRYLHNTQVWPSWCAQRYLFSVGAWDGPYPHPSTPSTATLELTGWTVGDADVWFTGVLDQDATIVVGFHWGLDAVPGASNFLDFQLWVSGIPQMFWPPHVGKSDMATMADLTLTTSEINPIPGFLLRPALACHILAEPY